MTKITIKESEVTNARGAGLTIRTKVQHAVGGVEVNLAGMKVHANVLYSLPVAGSKIYKTVFKMAYRDAKEHDAWKSYTAKRNKSKEE